MHLDHFVVHVDKDMKALKQLSKYTEQAGIPFNPRKGKGTSGFKATNIWIGNQYFEIPWLKRPDGGGWKKEWVDLYNKGNRGTFCVFLGTKNLEEIKARLDKRGIENSTEKVTFKAFGIFEKTMPWTCLYVPPLGESNLQISFIEYEGNIMEEWIKGISPNARDNGFEGIFHGEIQIPSLQKETSLLQAMFPNIHKSGSGFHVDLETGSLDLLEGKSTKVTLYAKTKNPEFVGKSFDFQDVVVKVVESQT